MQAARLATRLQREIAMLTTDPPPGVCAWPCGDLLTHLEAQIQGPAGTVYSSGLFKLDVRVPERYPFEPPNVRFVTPIYHPNIDTGGRICLDILVMPPKGAWRPSLNIPTVLASIGLLLSEPNPDDGLMSDITAEYKHNRSSFDRKARELTEKHALPSSCTENSADQKFPSVVVDCPAEGPSVRDFCERNSKRTLLSLGGKVLEADPQTISESSRVKVEAGSTPHQQRLGLARKLSLSQKPHQLVTDCGAKVPGINGTLEEKQPIEDKKTAEKQSGDDKGSTGAGQPTQHRLGTVLEETLEEQGLKQRASNPQDGNNAAPSVPVKSGREEPGRPSRLSLLSRLKLSRSIGSQQKPPASNVQQPTASVKRNLDCIVVSDSESEDDHVPVPRSRLTLTQRLRRYDNNSPQGL